MQSEQTNPSMEAKPSNEKLECTCFTLEDCEKHDLNPLKRLDIMEEAIEKVQDLADGGDKITSEQYITYFSYVFFFSSIRYYGTYTGVLYQKFVAALQDHITEVILPSLEGKDNVPLLMKTMDMWAKYQILAYWLLRFFEPLRPFCSMTKGTDISDVPYNLFCDWVFDRMWSRLRSVVLRMALNCISFEERRMGHYLPQNTMANVVEAMRYELIDKRIELWSNCSFATVDIFARSLFVV